MILATPLRVCLLVALGLAIPTVARAAPTEFAAIRVDQGLVYIDVGRRNGVMPGQALEVVTREGNDESFHLGWIVLESCGETVSLAHVPIELAPYIKQGTLLRLPVGTGAVASPPPPKLTVTPLPAPSAKPGAIAPPTPAPTTPPTTATPTPATAPTPPRVATTTPPRPETPKRGRDASVADFRHDAPTLVPPGVPLTLSVFAPAPLAKPLLMYRLAGERTYVALPFRAQPDSYYIVAIPADVVQAPGVEYYIVVDAPDGPRQLAFATPEEPARVDVEGRFNETAELARYGVRDEVSTDGELVSYSSASGVRDYYYRAEGDYLHRIFGTVYSMRFGAGYLHGVAVDATSMATNVGFLYAYSEAELRSATIPIAFIPRVIFGVNDSGVGGGFEARVRLGDELGMNFEGGVTVLSQLGFETFTSLTLHPLERTTIALAAYLENLPLANELGFRSYADLRYRVARATSLMVRLGVAARSIDTIGPDVGLGVALGF